MGMGRVWRSLTGAGNRPGRDLAGRGALETGRWAGLEPLEPRLLLDAAAEPNTASLLLEFQGVETIDGTVTVQPETTYQVDVSATEVSAFQYGAFLRQFGLDFTGSAGELLLDNWQHGPEFEVVGDGTLDSSQDDNGVAGSSANGYPGAPGETILLGTFSATTPADAGQYLLAPSVESYIVTCFGPAVIQVNGEIIVEIPEPHDDLGDAPAGYGTLRANQGPSHNRWPWIPDIHMGPAVDGEPDGQPNATATGDDNDIDPNNTEPPPNIDDEDGVTFKSLIVNGTEAEIEVEANAVCFLNFWIDYNGDGDFDDTPAPGDPAEAIHKVLGAPQGVVLAAGANTIKFAVPDNVAGGASFARFRVSSAGNLGATGHADDGEVEDYAVDIHNSEDPDHKPPDFGDAPDVAYLTTFLAGGPFHSQWGNNVSLSDPAALVPWPDSEADGQPGPLAVGDDWDWMALGGPAKWDDEDGVVFSNLWPLVTGVLTKIEVWVTAPGGVFLNAWIDFNGDGDFDDLAPGPGQPEERIDVLWADWTGGAVGAGMPVAPGSNVIEFVVPADSNTDMGVQPTFARFRISSAGALSPWLGAPDGEVEDYTVRVWPLVPDFGDAPDDAADPRYPTLLWNDGAYHYSGIEGFCLGEFVDYEQEGLPDDQASGDDQDDGFDFLENNEPDDEDGVTFDTPLVPGEMAGITVTAQTGVKPNGLLDAWVDFNADDDWNDPGEQILTNEMLDDGANALQFEVPADAQIGTTCARFRMSFEGFLTPTGMAENGEVEDYMVVIGELNPPTVTVDPLTTSDTTPVLTGTATAVAPATIVSVLVTVNGSTYAADVVNGAWTAQVTDALNPGTYGVLAEAEDSDGVAGTDTTADELEVLAVQPPTVTVNALDTEDPTPVLSGTVDQGEGGAIVAVNVTVNGQTYPATVSDNTWSAQVTDELPVGTYDVSAEAEDASGYVGTDQTADELTVSPMTPQTVTVGDEVRKIIYHDADGTKVTLKAKGLIDVTFIGANVDLGEAGKTMEVQADEALRIDAVNILADSTSLSLKTDKDGDGMGTIEDVAAEGAVTLKKLSGKKIDLIGGGIDLAEGIILSIDLQNILADVVMGGEAPKGVKIKAREGIDGADVRLGASGVKSLYTRVLIDSNVFAGVDAAVAGLPDATDDFVAELLIKKVTVKGVKGDKLAPAVSNSNIAASALGKLSLRNVETDNDPDGPFGVAYEDLAGLKVKQFDEGTFKFGKAKWDEYDWEDFQVDLLEA